MNLLAVIIINMNLTYIVAGVEVLFAVLGMAMGWISSAEGSALILAGLAVFGAKKSQVNAAQGVKGIW